MRTSTRRWNTSTSIRMTNTINMNMRRVRPVRRIAILIGMIICLTCILISRMLTIATSTDAPATRS